MRIAVFSTKPYDETFLKQAAEHYGHEVVFYENRLNEKTAPLTQGFPVACVFVHDDVNANVLEKLAENGTKLVALRCAGFNNVDTQKAKELGIQVVRVPAYSPYAVAEHTVALMLALNRKIYKAYNYVREGDFSLHGLLGFDMHQRTVGIVGTGKIGAVVAKIMHGFDCKILAYDVHENEDVKAVGGTYVTLEELFAQSDIISLHCPLLPPTKHMVNEESIKHMKDGVMLVNTSRGGLIKTPAVVDALKSGKIGYLALDVYEEEDELFFEDLSMQVIQDDVFSRLLTFPNVIITGHQAFFTREALKSIAETTMQNISDYEKGEELANTVG